VNLLLLSPGELAGDGTVRLDGRRATHLREVVKVAPGARVAAGVLGGRMGTAEVLEVSDAVVARVTLERDPPPRAPFDLVVALPRPKILRKVLQAAASMGVARVVLAGSWRVEKSYWGSPLLTPEALAAELRLGLEQGRDTLAPEVLLRRLFKPFVEDELDLLFPGAQRLLADERATTPLHAIARTAARAVLAVGPEGGFTPYEAGRLAELGFAPFTLGERALRVDVAVPFAAGQVALWAR
jgi:16S rRNA (uracil1498-N3)-methyltransferase